MYEAIESIKNVDNVWATVTVCTAFVCGVLALWIRHDSANTKKQMAANKEFERERTEHRKLERDKQIGELRNHFDINAAELSKRIDDAVKTASGVGKSLDGHIDDHKKYDSEQKQTIKDIDNRLRHIEGNLIERKEFLALQTKVIGIEMTAVRIETILTERLK